MQISSKTPEIAIKKDIELFSFLSKKRENENETLGLP